MNHLYLFLDLGALFFPFILSFDKKVHYVTCWKQVVLAAISIAIPFLIHDYIFTEKAIWGFNPEYLTGHYLLNLPIEEVSFFIIVPFCCLFIYQCLKAYFPNIQLPAFNKGLYISILIYGCIIFIVGFGNWYSSSVAIPAILLALFLFQQSEKYPFLPLAFALSMIPFFLMNSALTGSFTPNPVVWYNNSENIGFRWGTIPAEDILYSFVLIAGNILLFEFLSRKKVAVTA